MPTVHILDYVAGNVRSLANAIERLGFTIKWITNPEDIEHAEVSKNAHYVESALMMVTIKHRDSLFLVSVILDIVLPSFLPVVTLNLFGTIL